MNNESSIPWIEKYRPSNFNEIVLDDTNKIILENILNSDYFPNLLFYGPPGTGKTTTIVNLVSAFREKNNQTSSGLVIHLNASDERGIDVVRNQISSFVNSMSLFANNKSTKFVILDEVDYMTTNAQYALKYLMQGQNNVRFCLICNYISKIDESLRNEFIRLRFNQLPDKDVVNYLQVINTKENLNMTEEQLDSIKKYFGSDVRSMINYMQSSQTFYNVNLIISDDRWEDLIQFLIENKEFNNKNEKKITKIFKDLSKNYKMPMKTIIKEFINYLIRIYTKNITNNFLETSEFIVHLQESNNEDLLGYILPKLIENIPKICI
jgi:replication factor C subunit 3/5